ncbi:MAG: hypothetical protein GY714_08625 [Desulfobacterales bacterium]|nr:hypothetical protein [Desulfobacterales bacterium]
MNSSSADIKIGAALSASVGNIINTIKKNAGGISASSKNNVGKKLTQKKSNPSKQEAGVSLSVSISENVDSAFEMIEQKKDALSKLLTGIPVGTSLTETVDNTFGALEDKKEAVSELLSGIPVGASLSETVGNTFAALESKKEALGEILSGIPMGTTLSDGVDGAFDFLTEKSEIIQEQLGGLSLGGVSTGDLFTSLDAATEKAGGFGGLIKNIGSEFSAIGNVFKGGGKKDSGPKGKTTEPEDPETLLSGYKSALSGFKSEMNIEVPEHFKEIGNDLLALTARTPIAAKGMGKMMSAVKGVTSASQKFKAIKGSVARIGESFGVTGEQAKTFMASLFPSLGPLGEKLGSVLQPMKETWNQAKALGTAASESWKTASEGYSFLKQNVTSANAVMLKNSAITVASAAKNRMLAASTWAVGAAQRAVSVVTKVWTFFQWGLNAAMLANPIGLIIAGVVALGGLAFVIFKQWKPIVGFFTGIIGFIGDIFTSLWGIIGGVFNSLWEIIGGVITSIVEGIKSIPFIGTILSFFGSDDEDEKEKDKKPEIGSEVKKSAVKKDKVKAKVKKGDKDTPEVGAEVKKASKKRGKEKSGTSKRSKPGATQSKKKSKIGSKGSVDAVNKKNVIDLNKRRKAASKAGKNKKKTIGNKKTLMAGKALEKSSAKVVDFDKQKKKRGIGKKKTAPKVVEKKFVEQNRSKQSIQKTASGDVAVSFTGDININATDGKIDQPSFISQIEEAMNEIRWRNSERSFSDVG